MNKKLGIFIIIGLLALIGIGFYFYVQNTSTNNEETNYEANRTSTESNTSNEENTSNNESTADANTTEITNTNSENTSNADNTDDASKTVEEQLSAFSTKIYSNDANRTKNMEITTSTLDGTIVKKGETFSFCNTVGPATSSKGYLEADIYDHDGNKKKGYGGGNCQVSSTLYNAVLYSNLEIVERKNHRFVPSYSDAGRDATVVYGAIDFRFKNTRNYPIKIMFSVSGGVAKCEIFGLKENPDYEVEISSKVTERTSTTIKSVTYKTVKQNGQVISSGIINRDTYKRH